MIPYGKQSIDDDDIQEVVKVLKSDFITTGPKIAEFEVNFAKVVGAKYAVAVSNGTAALHVACLAAGLKQGDESITTPMTFAASANCALYCGAKPVFADVDESGLILPSEVEKKVTMKTKTLIPVHYTGMPCNLKELKEIADNHHIVLIEDGCHALGSKYGESKIGDCTFSDMTVFSFHPVKHITTGEGGMVTTNSPDLYFKLKTFRTHGIVSDPAKFTKPPDGPWIGEQQMLGFNYRMTDIQAALGNSQLKKLGKFVERRREIVNIYDSEFKEHLSFTVLKEPVGKFSSHHLYPILLRGEIKEKKRQIFEELRKNGLGVQVHYVPVYWHPYYQQLGYTKGLCPHAEDFSQREISIPLYPAMSDADVGTVVDIIKKVGN